MKADLKEKWVKALRSGRYEQTSGLLSKGRGHVRGESNCCLGVLCRVARVPRDVWEHEAFLSDVNWRKRNLADVLGITTTQEDALASRNDDGKPFSEIADYIEANL